MSKDKYQDIAELIAKHPDIVSFGDIESGVSDEWIQKAEERLSVKFPPSYIWWLKQYGGGQIYGDEIYSVYQADFDTVVGGDIVYMNELHRKRKFCTINQLSILATDQGDSYYLDLSEVNEQGESPVYNHFTKERYAKDFLEFLEKQVTGI